MTGPIPDIAAKQREQRIVLAVGLIVAGLPIVIQILMAVALTLDSTAFPTADRTLTEARFWPVQVVLLCVAIAGNAAVDYVRLILRGKTVTGAALALFLFLLLFFIVVSIMFSVSLLDSKIGWLWLTGMGIFGMIDLALAYLLEMELATYT